MALRNYIYRAYNQAGKVETGQMHAASEKEVVMQLKSRSLYPFDD